MEGEREEGMKWCNMKLGTPLASQQNKTHVLCEHVSMWVSSNLELIPCTKTPTMDVCSYFVVARTESVHVGIDIIIIITYSIHAGKSSALPDLKLN